MSLRDEWNERYPSASQRCPRCHRTFHTLADEVGEHDCPHCGFSPFEDDDEPEPEDEDPTERSLDAPGA